MFYLEIKSANKPVYNFIACSKICSGLYLVNGPLILKLVCDLIRNRKCSMFYGMCKLEYNTEHKPCEQSEHQEPYHPLRESKHIDRQCNKYESMQKFESPEDKMITKLHWLQ